MNYSNDTYESLRANLCLGSTFIHCFVNDRNLFSNFAAEISRYMVVVFDKEYLRDLYVNGATTDKQHRFQADIVKRYKKGVDYLKWASRKEDLFRINSLHFEALTGDRAGRFSIRVNNKYRIEFTITETAEVPVLTVCNIMELSNHYD